MSFIVVVLLYRLSLFQAKADVVEERLALSHCCGDGSHPSVTSPIGPDGWGITSIDHSEGRLAQGRLIGGVVCKLRPWQPPEPIPRTIAGEAAQVHGDDAVGCLGLAIRLRVKRNGHM